MAAQEIKKAVSKEEVLRLHLISGEFYTGPCYPDTDHTGFFKVDTSGKSVSLPYWAVKRFERLH
ncbi:hypothetical protein QWJ34_18455 [Saccharibacillus sp. CPCC 101409]|uniref:hypothetical protein n=1 Tax=Saccharibacillus sp. CPCC 101409 TaxID=3058041 RepID=UPI0026727D4B|nr:hypothetical protein [Saccharibacillus sp. CPCC 101409]MDO3411751.1 hypothetical protein [Saccharibacillus sp. CPCC 101409]